MTDTGWYRLGLLSGVVGVALFVASLVAAGGNPPAPDATSLKVAQGVHDHREGLLASTILVTLAATVYLWFVSVVRSVLAEAEGGQRTLANTYFGSSLAAIILAPLGFVPFAASAFRLAEPSGAQLAARADLIRLTFDLANMLSVVGGCMFGVGAFAVAVIILRTGVMATWIAGLSGVIAILAVLGVLGVAAVDGPFAVGGPVFLASFLSFLLWSLVVAVALFRRPAPLGTSAGTARTSEVIQAS